MPRSYEITAPNGRKFQIEAPDDTPPEEIERLAREAAGVSETYPVQRRHQELSADARRIYDSNNQLSGEGGYRDLITQGLSFGLSDEAAGVANMLMHPLTSGAYAAGRDATRARVDDARETTGWAGTLSELGGGLLTGAPLQQGAKALLSLGQSAKQGLKLGALGGAIGGFGSGDGAVDSLIKSGIGATLGGTLGVAVPTAVQLIGNRVSGAQRLIGADTENLARRITGEALLADGNTPAQVGQRLTSAAERGTPLALADTGDNARGLLASVSRRPGAARTLARGTVEPRQAEQSDRVLGAIGENLGPIRNMRQQSDELMQQADVAATPLYDEFRALPGRTSEELESILATPAGRSAITRARTIAANERRDPTKLGFDLDDQGEVVLRRFDSPETIDLVKRGLDDILEDARDPLTGQIKYTPQLRGVESVRSSLLREADSLYPVYGSARAAYAGPASAEEALQLGRRSLTASAEDIEVALGRMGEAEREQFALGFRAAMADNIGRAVDGADQAQRMLGTPRKRAALAAVFGGEENFGRFLATMADERATNQTYRSVMTGSQTAERLAADAQTSDGGMLETASGAALRGVSQPVSMLGDALKALGEVGRFGAGEAGDRTRESVAALLTETDPSVLEGLAKAIKDATTRQRLRARNINRVTGRVGAGVGNSIGQLVGSSTGGD